MSPLAAFISGGRDLGSAIEKVKLAESLGYDAVFSTHTTGRDGLMLLAAYAANTSSIRLGTGVIPAFPRHPLSLAIEAATLDEITGGRLILGVGPSHAVTTEGWYGLSIDRALSRMREYVDVLRQVFTTDGATHDGEFYNVRYGFLGYGARKDLPIYLAALSPNMLRFAGEAADGVVLWGCLPSYIRATVAGTVAQAAADAGRPAPQIVAAIPAQVTADRAAAFDELRKDFFVYMTLPFYRRVIAAAGYDADIAAFDKAQADGDFPGALAAISDAMLDSFAAIGDAEAVRAKIAEYRSAGATLPAIGAFGRNAHETLQAAIG